MSIRSGQYCDEMWTSFSPKLPDGVGEEEGDLSNVQKCVEISQTILWEVLNSTLLIEFPTIISPITLANYLLPRLPIVVVMTA